MIQCKDCEYYQAGPKGQKVFKCNPFETIKEPHCIAKWQLIRLDMLVASYQKMTGWYEKLAPLQDKIFRYMQQEIDDVEDSDSWKYDDEDEDEDNDQLA